MLELLLGADQTRPLDHPLSRRAQRRHRDRVWWNVAETARRTIGLDRALGRLLGRRRTRPGDAVERRCFLEQAEAADVVVNRFRESYFPGEWTTIKESFRALITPKPDIVFSHRRDDEHQDHRIIGELTWNTFRDHLIAEYEIPKYEGDLGQPNLYVPLAEETVERKVALLLEHFPSQRTKPWFRPELFRGLMALRGIECNAPQGWAEAFHVRKAVVTFGGGER